MGQTTPNKTDNLTQSACWWTKSWHRMRAGSLYSFRLCAVTHYVMTQHQS